jgi:DNA-binding transcriptional MerR regulator
MMKKKTISAKEIVKRFNIPYHTVNYYTAIGLLPVLGKNGNERIYEEKEVKRRLAKISKLIKEGYPLHLIRKKIVGI